MTEYKKNCPENSFEPKKTPEQDYVEYSYAKNYFLIAENNSKNENTIRPSIDIYFTAIQNISNALLLKKLKIRSKISSCAYYKLYLEKIISKELYEKIELLREKRNTYHYDAYLAMLTSEEDVKRDVLISKEIYLELIKKYEK